MTIHVFWDILSYQFYTIPLQIYKKNLILDNIMLFFFTFDEEYEQTSLCQIANKISIFAYNLIFKDLARIAWNCFEGTFVPKNNLMRLERKNFARGSESSSSKSLRSIHKQT